VKEIAKLANHKYLERMLLLPINKDGPCDDEYREAALQAIHTTDVVAVRGNTVATHGKDGVVWMETAGGIVKFNWLPASDINHYVFAMNTSSLRDVSSALAAKSRITMDEFITRY